MPFGMLVVKTPGPSGIIKVKISKQLINNPQAIRYTIATFAPSQPPNFDTLFQGGSSAVDVFPGTKETFGGEINGYGESTPLGDGMTSDYTIYYVYSGINPIVEYAPNGSVLARYIYAGGLHIAKIAGADTHYYHCDALGSPRKMTDERGSTVWSATYYPFGEMTAGSNNTHGFTGKEFDSEMGLNYFCQRYYDPEIGRFMTLDPFAGYIELPQSQNRYAYCIGNPLKYIDPLGLVNQVIVDDSDYGPMVDPGVVCTAPRWNSPLNPRWMSYLESILSLGSDVDEGGYEGIWPHGGKGGGRKRYGSGKSGGKRPAPARNFPQYRGPSKAVASIGAVMIVAGALTGQFEFIVIGAACGIGGTAGMLMSPEGAFSEAEIALSFLSAVPDPYVSVPAGLGSAYGRDIIGLTSSGYSSMESGYNHMVNEFWSTYGHYSGMHWWRPPKP